MESETSIFIHHIRANLVLNEGKQIKLLFINLLLKSTNDTQWKKWLESRVIGYDQVAILNYVLQKIETSNQSTSSKVMKPQKLPLWLEVSIF